MKTAHVFKVDTLHPSNSLYVVATDIPHACKAITQGEVVEVKMVCDVDIVCEDVQIGTQKNGG